MGVNLHFLNVGVGDCTIVHFPERTRKDGKKKDERVMMVDIFHHEDHDDYHDVIEYYKAHFKNTDGSFKPIFRFVCSHPHQDHICGLARLLEEEGIIIHNFWDLEHSFEPDDFSGHPTHEDDWKAYRALGGPTKPPITITTTREDEPKQFWNDDEDRIAILSPSAALIKYAHYKEDGTKRDPEAVEIDEMSYALSININGRRIILAGDGRATPCWDDIYENCKAHLPSCAVLKAGHHGHECAFHEDAVKLMNPSLIIFSNSEDQDKENGAEKKYKKAVPNATLLKTCDSGTVVVEVPFDEKESVKYWVSK